MKVRVLTPGAVLFDEEAFEVSLPGTDGIFSVWDFHQDCVCTLVNGQVVIRIKVPSGGGHFYREIFSITHGIARVKDGVLVVMAEELPLSVKTADKDVWE